jgi:GR25 family glycosyltransferase involved in LPS biosynthesis
MKIDKVYYINLDKREDRKKFMEDQLSTINIPYERFSAICPTEEDIEGKYKSFYSRYVKHEDFSTTKRIGTFGCYLSHYFVHKKALDSDHGNYLILEDDWTINQDCIEEIKDCFDKSLIGQEWDMFGSFWSSHQKIVLKYKGIAFHSRFWNNRRPEHPPLGGAHFILFNKKSCSKIVNFLEVENIFGIDYVYCNDMLNVYHKKLPTKNNQFVSDIQS